MHISTMCYLILTLFFHSFSLVFGADVSSARKIQEFYDQLPNAISEITNTLGQEIRSVTGDITFVKEIEMEPRNDQEVMKIVAFMAKRRDRKLVVGAGNFQSGSQGFQGLSIGAHAQGIQGDVYLSTRKMKKHTLRNEDFTFDPKDETITLTVGAGNAWAEAMALANSTLNATDRNTYEFVPFCAPTSERVSIAGSLTSHGHSRTTAFLGGYMPEAVVKFSLVTMRRGRVVKLLVSREQYPELFYALPGSFGRGGVITDITIKLQRIPKNTRVLMSVTRYDDYEQLLQDYEEAIDTLNTSEEAKMAVQRPFLSAFVSVTSSGSLYLFKSKLVSDHEAKTYPYFDFFEKPGVKTSIIQAFAHNFTETANGLIDSFLTGRHHSKTYKNHPVSWIFGQDSFLIFTQQYEKYKLSKEHTMLAHQAYVLPRKAMVSVFRIAKDLQKKYQKQFDLFAKWRTSFL